MERCSFGHVSYFVSLDLVFIADKSYVEEVILPPQLSECNADVGFEVVPPKTELFRRHPVAGLFSGNQTRSAEDISETEDVKVAKNCRCKCSRRS